MMAAGGLKDEFPLTAKVNYLNTAGVGLIPASVIEGLKSFYERGLTRPPYDELFDENAEVVEETRAAFAKFINAAPAEVSFQANASTSLGTVMQMIKFRKGDNVVVDDLGFPSDIYPALALRRKGVEVRMLRNTNGYVSSGDYDRGVDDRTRLIVTSFVSWINGMRADVEAIGRLAEERGSYLMVDATHGAGYLEMDVRRWRVDFLATSNYKWLLAPFGASEFYISRRRLDEFDPPLVGWHSVVGDSRALSLENYELPRSARKFEPGNPDYAGVYGLGESLRYLARVGSLAIEKKVLRLSGRIMDGLSELGIEILTPRQDMKRSAFFFARARRIEGPVLAEKLKRRKIWVSARYFGDRSGLRIAPYFYNSDEDVEELLGAVASILRSG